MSLTKIFFKRVDLYNVKRLRDNLHLKRPHASCRVSCFKKLDLPNEKFDEIEFNSWERFLFQRIDLSFLRLRRLTFHDKIIFEVHETLKKSDKTFKHRWSFLENDYRCDFASKSAK